MISTLSSIHFHFSKNVLTNLTTHLFSFQCKLNENLLQFLIDIVNAKLFKAILLEDLKTIDIQDANVYFQSNLPHGNIDCLQAEITISNNKTFQTSFDHSSFIWPQ